MRRRGFDRNFPENCNLICFGLGLSPRNENNNGNFKNVVILPLWCYYRGKILSFLFLCACKISRLLKVCALILPLCRHPSFELAL